MKWKIEKSRFDATHLMVNIEFNPKNDVLGYCLAQIKISNYPEFISFQSKSMTYGEEHVHIKNYSDMDWEDKAWANKIKGSEIEEGEMFLVHDVVGETIIKEAIFDKILFDYGPKLKEVYHADKLLPENWKMDMVLALEKLQVKIAI